MVRPRQFTVKERKDNIYRSQEMVQAKGWGAFYLSGAGLDSRQAFEIVGKRSRDNSRTPMQWDAGKNAGFSSSDHTWIKVNRNYRILNVKAQETETQSVLKFYRDFIRLRQEEKYGSIMVSGQFVPYEVQDSSVIAYERTLQERRLLLLCNYQNTKTMVEIPQGYKEKVIGNYEHTYSESRQYCLNPYECIVLYRKE